MNELDQISILMGEIANGNSNPQEASATPVASEGATTNTAETTVTETSSTPNVESSTATANVQSDTKAATEEIDDWDEPEIVSTTSTTTASAPDESWKEIGNVLNLNADKKEVVIEEIKKLSDTKKTLENEIASLKSSSDYASDDIKKANEIAKAGGDWKSYLQISSIDYDAYDDTTLIEADVRKYFPSTEEGQAELTSYLESISDSERKVRGAQIREMLKSEQANRKIEVERTAKEQKMQADENLRKALDSMNDVYGYKLKPSNKTEIYNDISSGKMVNSMFYNDKGELDFNKMAKNAFILKNFEKLLNYYRNNSKNEGKQEVINSINNLDLNQTSQLPTATAQTKSPLDNWISSMS